HVLDYRTNELIWDERIYEFWGLPPGTPVTLELFRKGIHPDDLKRVEAAVDNLNDPSSGGKYFIQYRVIGIQTGIERCLELTGHTFYEDGKPSRFVGTAIDITDRKRAEEQIAHLLERFDLATRAAHLGVWDWDIIHDHLVWDDRMYELYGVKREDFSGAYETWLKGLHPDDRAQSDEISKQSLRGEKEYNTEFRVVLPDGSIRWLRSFGQVLRDADGKPQRMIGINNDITEQKQAEELIKASEARYRRLFENMQEAFFVVEIIRDESGNPLDIRYLEANAACLSRAGRKKREEMVGHTYLELFFPNPTFDVWLTRFSEVALTGKSDHFEQFAEATGLYFEVFAYSPQIGQCAVVLNDITERKQAEEEKNKLQEQLLQSQKLESIGRLAGGVAHDYNNMLGIIIGRSEAAMTKLDIKEPVYSDLREILQAAERSADLSRQLLTFARKQPVNLKVINLNNAITDMIGMHRRLIGENIELIWTPWTNLWAALFDPSQINQILANLLINARDAIADIGKITVETNNEVLNAEDNLHYPGMPAGEYVVLTVSDTGCGMEPEILTHIFEPFFTTKEIGKGTGLGLATVFGIVKQNDGYIFVTSQPGKGSVFKIYLPRFKEEISFSDEKDLSGDIPSGENETVLIVEDEEALLQLSQETLEELGYTVLAASSPVEALRLAEEHGSAIRLLITDVVMPGMNGRDLAEKIKAICPETRCLFMSGYAADIITQHEVLSEGVGFIQKPFRLNEFAEAVRCALEK
ncbi:MAG: PAS domain-containing protein, partial [Chloroflexota bacterium]